MDHQSPHLQNPESDQNRSPESQPPNQLSQSGEIPGADAAKAESQPERRHRRSRLEDRRADSRAGKNSRNPSKGKSKLTMIQQTDRIVLWGCYFLGALVVFAGGFYMGQKSGHHTDMENQVAQQDAAFPSPETDALLDAGFEAFQKGSYRDAMENFQHVLDKQPTLVGLDYLIAESAYLAGEKALAEEAAGHALSKNESVEQARVLLSLIDLDKSNSAGDGTQQLADPKVTAESAIKQLVASHLAEAKGYGLWGDFLRSNGSYRSAADILHKGVLRADTDASRDLLSAKEQIARFQDNPPTTVPSLSEVTSMSGEQALVAALAALQKHQVEEAVSFLEHARDLYSPLIFQKLMKDVAFADYSKDPQLKQFFNAR